MADADCGDWGTSIIAITALLEALVLVIIALRIYTRIWIAHAFWWDDFTMILAVVSYHAWSCDFFAMNCLTD